MNPAIQALEKKLSDKRWRLENLYLILEEGGGEPAPIELRQAQSKFLDNRKNRNFVPKARKLGLSTIIVLDNGDECIFNANTRAGIIDLTRIDAFDKLEIFKFAWDNGPFHPDPDIAALWRSIHANNPLISEAAGKLEWKNGSGYTGGTSYTGKTPQRLHISEFGPISAAAPMKALKIKRGSINSVPPNGIIDIETTMEGGEYGECYQLFDMALSNEGKVDPTIMDWKMQFFSWLDHPSYKVPGSKAFNGPTLDYFKMLKDEHGLEVSDERQAFYEAKKREQGEEIFLQFPTIIEELSRRSVPGQIYPEMTKIKADGRVRSFTKEQGYPVFTCWDLGSSDNMAGWLVQPAGKDHNWLKWCAGEGAGASGVAEVIRAWEADGPIAGHLVPHDANLTDKGSGKTYVDQLVECGIPREKIIIIPRISDMWVGVDEVRRILPNSWFHSDCDEIIETATGAKLPSGVGRLVGYRKKIDKSTGITRDVDVHDICSHTADAIRTYAEALSKDLVVANVAPKEGGVIVRSGFRGR